jgi:uncharacterized membrane protein YqjE
VRTYAVLMAVGCTVALGSFALVGLPILVTFLRVHRHWFRR